MSYINKFENNLNVIGRQLKKQRIKAGYSQEQLSTKLALMGIIIHKQGIYDIENNKRTVKDYELLGLSKALKIDINKLFTDMENKLNEY